MCRFSVFIPLERFLSRVVRNEKGFLLVRAGSLPAVAGIRQHSIPQRETWQRRRDGAAREKRGVENQEGGPHETCSAHCFHRDARLNYVRLCASSGRERTSVVLISC